MNRLSCRLALVSVSILAATGLSSCSFVQPPALTASQDASSSPFLTVSADEVFAGVNKDSGAGPTSTREATVSADSVAEFLTGKVRPAILKQVMAQRNVAPTEDDRTAVQKAAQQQQTPPSQDEIDFQIDFKAMSDALAKDFFALPGNNLEDYARKYYDQRKDSFAVPAQTCLHVVSVDAGDGQTRPTDDQINQVLPQAQALRQRLNTESFAEVSKSSGRSAANIPGGDLGCGPEGNLPESLTGQLKDLPIGQISNPLKWELGWVVVRVDDRKVARTPPFEEVRSDAEAATRQTFGQQFVTELLSKIYAQYVVKVDPRFGRWDVQKGQVIVPEGAASPTIPTTTTTMPSLVENPTGPTPGPGAGGTSSTTTSATP